ncbi:MAG: hypothetical protein A2W03_08590 [Candidatus Aminicenantes bacterium RBG_16_63_16]|nr:MAG: hypothetical protein A2W03_08590 [Candidatus Aminicenantes bacterium RBG_16_63_16]
MSKPRANEVLILVKKRIFVFLAGIAVSGLSGTRLPAQGYGPPLKPETHVFATVDGVNLKAYVFRPDEALYPSPRLAIVIFHGGGWSLGEPEWAFGRAQHFAGQGMVGVAAQYRLSDQKKVTPLEAMVDARAVIRWLRSNSGSLGIDPSRIAAYGWSSGGHLAVSAAIFDKAESSPKVSAAPDALILVSPAVHLETDSWVQRLLGSRASASSISPASHVRAGLPPTIILQGDVDTVTPLAGARLFRDRMVAAGNRCELHIYPGMGHMFTPAGIPDDGWPQPDPKVQADALKKAVGFLASLGYIKQNAPGDTSASTGGGARPH